MWITSALDGCGWWPLTREQAVDRAREHVDSQGLPFSEPVAAHRTLGGGWTVMTNKGYRGGNIFMTITRSGKVRGGRGITPR
jgi:hypothetical protein